MLAAIFEQDYDTFDIFTIIAAIVFVIAAVLALPPRPAPAGAYHHMVGWLALALFSFGFLFMTP